MPLVLKELASSEATNRRNAAFCVGELCKNGHEPALKYPSSFYVPFDSCMIILLCFGFRFTYELFLWWFMSIGINGIRYLKLSFYSTIFCIFFNPIQDTMTIYYGDYIPCLVNLSLMMQWEIMLLVQWQGWSWYTLNLSH